MQTQALNTKLLTHHQMQMMAQYFELFTCPTRLSIISVLCHHADQKLSVSEIIALCRHPQPNVSRHLGMLADAGITNRERVGTQVFYSLADSTIPMLCEMVMKRFDQCPA